MEFEKVTPYLCASRGVISKRRTKKDKARKDRSRTSPLAEGSTGTMPSSRASNLNSYLLVGNSPALLQIASFFISNKNISFNCIKNKSKKLKKKIFLFQINFKHPKMSLYSSNKSKFENMISFKVTMFPLSNPKIKKPNKNEIFLFSIECDN